MSNEDATIGAVAQDKPRVEVAQDMGKGPELVEISKLATLELYIGEGEDEKLVSTEQLHRGLLPVFKRITEHMADYQEVIQAADAALIEAEAARNLELDTLALETCGSEGCIATSSEAPALIAARARSAATHAAMEEACAKVPRVFAYLTCKDREGNDRKLKIVDARLKDALASLAKRMYPPQAVMERIQIMLSQMAEISSLKGVILTTVFGDAQAAGFGFLSESIEVTDEDIKVLGVSAASQADMFKDAMRKQKNIDFPGDSRIITPGQAGIFVR